VPFQVPSTFTAPEPTDLRDGTIGHEAARRHPLNDVSDQGSPR
jgi:hypothetical protein